MNVSYNWLKQYVDLDGISPEELADRLTNSGLEVEGLEPMAYATKLVVGQVKECVKHPDSDHLHICQVDDGTGVRQIVCGAPNVEQAVGKKVIVALPGCQLKGGTIEAAKKRGVESDGMICALFELGVDKKSLSEQQNAGIEILDDNAVVGDTNVLSYLGLDDTILDVSLTPNRADCLGMWALARQTGAVLNRPVHIPEEYKADHEEPSTLKLATKTTKCPWYIGKVIHHVKIGPSPDWIQKALRSNGVKSINNVVDISNLVMLETGQPLHYYDLKKIKGPEITVVDGLKETYTALDGISYPIEPEDIMITNEGNTIGIAGIMGGDDSKIDEDTDSILIEAASFDHVTIRNTALRLNLMTEAAQRFIKMVEPGAAQKAVWRSVELLSKYADASGIEETVAAGDPSVKKRTITLTSDKVNAVLGTSFTLDEIRDTLSRLNLQPEMDGHKITVTIPDYRMNDLAIPEDIIEEIIEIQGYDHIISTLPQMPQTIGRLEPVNVASRTIKNYLRMAGLHEIETYSLVGKKSLQDAVMPLGDTPVTLKNPISEERKYYRTSLASSMLETVAFNKAHSQTNFGLFEIASVYAENKEFHTRLSIGITGLLVQSDWKKDFLEADFYTLKGMLYGMLNQLGYNERRIEVKPVEEKETFFHPYQSAKLYLDHQLIGVFGMVHPAKQKDYDIEPTVLAEIDLTTVLSSKPAKLRFVPIPKYPSTSYDLSLIVSEDVTAETISHIVHQNGTKWLKDIHLFDIYKGVGITEGTKAVAIRLTFRSDERTLSDQDIKPVVSGIVDALQKEVKAVIRA